jgi:hypothetical protein
MAEMAASKIVIATETTPIPRATKSTKHVAGHPKLIRRNSKAAQNNDPEMAADATEYERRALEAIKQHLAELPGVEKPAVEG